MTEEQKAQARELMTKIATACKEYDVLVVMNVLEAAITAEIAGQDELVGKLFEEMMAEFRSQAMIVFTASMLMKASKTMSRRAPDVVDSEEQ